MDFVRFRMPKELWNTGLMRSLCQTMVGSRKSLLNKLSPSGFWYDLYWFGKIGGRQLDGAIPSLYALERICKSQRVKEAQRSGRLHVFFDSGVRTGPDMFKALALGAQAILRKSSCFARDPWLPRFWALYIYSLHIPLLYPTIWSWLVIFYVGASYSRECCRAKLAHIFASLHRR